MKPKIRQKRRVSAVLSPKTQVAHGEARRPGAPGWRPAWRKRAARGPVVAGCEETKAENKIGIMLICRFFGLVRWCTITRVQPLLLSGARAVHQLQVSLPDAECERSVTVAIHTYVSSRCRGALTGRLVASLSRTFACRRRASSCRSPHDHVAAIIQ